MNIVKNYESKMDVLNAYEIALEKLEELKEEGIKVKMIPSRSRSDKDAIEEYSTPENLPADKWYHVTLEFKNETQRIKIIEAANYLGMCGITFDSGGWSNYRDWELDWSFRYKNKEDENRRNMREAVEDIIVNLPENNNERT